MLCAMPGRERGWTAKEAQTEQKMPRREFLVKRDKGYEAKKKCYE
jgi:hypothetical protein